MRLHPVVLFSATVAAIAACNPEQLPTTSTPRESLAAPVSMQRMVDRTVSGSITVIMAYYDHTAPADRVQLALLPGVRVVSNSWRRQDLSLEVADSALPRVTATLLRLPWIRSIRLAAKSNVHAVGGHMLSKASGMHLTAAASTIPGPSSFLLTGVVPWGIHFTNADFVQSTFATVGTGVKVGVMDTGITCSNTDFGSVRGVNYVTSDTGSYCNDLYGHGTQVAGIIAAAGNNVLGMAPGVTLYSIRILDDEDRATTDGLKDGIEFAIDSGIQVLNMSWGDCGVTSTNVIDADVKADIADAVSAGMVIVFAAGNGTADGCLATDSVSNYAALPGVIGVSAVDSGGASPANFQYSSKIWLAAPNYVETDAGTGTTASFGGTSAATPHVSGAAALLIARNGLSAAGVKSVLAHETQARSPLHYYETFLNDSEYLAHDDSVGYGVLDVAAAIVPTPQFVSYSQTCGYVVYAGQTCSTTYTLGSWVGYSPYYIYWVDAIGTVDTSHSLTYTFVVPGDGTGNFGMMTNGYPLDTVTTRHTRTGLYNFIYYRVCPGTDSLPPMYQRSRPATPWFLKIAPPAAKPTAPMAVPRGIGSKPTPPRYLNLDLICPS
jgi:subtilisin family serine protease